MEDQIAKNQIKYTPSARVKSIDEDSGNVRFTLTQKAVDRHGEVVEPAGVKLENYMTNPIVLFGHGMGNQVPIGKLDTGSITISDESIEADVIFDESGDDPFSKMISSKVKNGFLNAGSIGFKPLEISEEKGLDGQTGVTHTKWELMEFSIVPIPALPSALATREYEEYATVCKGLGFDMPANEIEVMVKAEPTTADEFNEEEIIAEVEEKAGAVLNSKNKQLINSAIEDLEKAVASLKDVMGKTSTEEAPEAEVETEKLIEEAGSVINDIRESLGQIKVRRELSALHDSLN